MYYSSRPSALRFVIAGSAFLLLFAMFSHRPATVMAADPAFDQRADLPVIIGSSYQVRSTVGTHTFRVNAIRGENWLHVEELGKDGISTRRIYWFNLEHAVTIDDMAAAQATIAPSSSEQPTREANSEKLEEQQRITLAIQTDLSRIHDATLQYIIENDLKDTDPPPTIQVLVEEGLLRELPKPPIGDAYLPAKSIAPSGAEPQPEFYPEWPGGNADNARLHPELVEAAND